MQIRKYTTLRFIVVACLAIVVGAMWWVNRPSEHTKRPPLRKLRVAHLVALDMAPHFVAKEAGYFEEVGLDVELAFFGVHENNAALAARQVDMSITPFTLPYLALNEGVPMRAVAGAGGWGIVQVVIQGDYNVHSLEELAAYVRSHPDEKIKVGALKGDNIDLIVTDAVRQVGLTRQDFEMVLVKHILDLVELFKKKEIGILSHIKPYTTDLIVNHGAQLLTDDAAVWNINTPNCVIAVLDDLLTHEPHVVEAYLKAVRKAASLLNTAPEKAIGYLKNATYPHYFKVGYDVVLEALQSQPTPITFTPSIDAVNAVMFEMVQEHYIDAYIPARKVFRLGLIRQLESAS